MKTAPAPSQTTQQLFPVIETEMREVERRLRSETKPPLPVIRDIGNYVHDGGGKRLRPALLLLLSRMCGVNGHSAVPLAVVIELIHAATLVHDDIIDRSDLRRGRPSANARWGNELTVLFGDWLYMTAFAIALQERNFRILQVLIDITRGMVQGEIMQLERSHDLDVSIDDHYEICRHKTANLFAGCGRLASMLGGLDPESEERLASFGESLGMAFQLIDDLLDYTADSNVLGKPVLKDLEEGKVTLPIIHLRDHSNGSQRQFLLRVMARRDYSPENKERILELVKSQGGLSYLRTEAQRFAHKAVAALDPFADSIYKETLLQLPSLILNRRM